MGVFFAVPPYKKGGLPRLRQAPYLCAAPCRCAGDGGVPHGWVCALRPAFDKGPADSPVKTVCALRKNDDAPAAEKPAAGGRQQSMRGAQN